MLSNNVTQPFTSADSILWPFSRPLSAAVERSERPQITIKCFYPNWIEFVVSAIMLSFNWVKIRIIGIFFLCHKLVSNMTWVGGGVNRIHLKKIKNKRNTYKALYTFSTCFELTQDYNNSSQSSRYTILLLGAIHMLRNAVGVSAFPEKSFTKVYGSTLFALRGSGWGSHLKGPIYKMPHRDNCSHPGPS